MTFSRFGCVRGYDDIEWRVAFPAPFMADPSVGSPAETTESDVSLIDRTSGPSMGVLQSSDFPSSRDNIFRQVW